jgi:hypothetical protein
MSDPFLFLHPWILHCVFVRTFEIPFYYGSGTVISSGSGSDFLKSYGSGSTTLPEDIAKSHDYRIEHKKHVRNTVVKSLCAVFLKRMSVLALWAVSAMVEVVLQQVQMLDYEIINRCIKWCLKRDIVIELKSQLKFRMSNMQPVFRKIGIGRYRYLGKLGRFFIKIWSILLFPS